MAVHSAAIYIDPPSHHFLGDRLFDPHGAQLAGDQLHAPYEYVRRFFSARGIQVRTADYLPPSADGTPAIYVSMGILSNYRRLAQERPDVIRSAYFALECPIVEPRMYRALADAQHSFKRIYSWSTGAALERFVGTRVECHPFSWPQSFDDVHEDIWRAEDRRFLAIINANKLPRLYYKELYTERMRAVAHFARFDEVDLYGKGWDQPSIRVGRTWVPWTFRRIQHELTRRWQTVRPDPLLEAARRAYRGVAMSKAETLGRYTFALCFENARLDGWITEKIFDCLFAGTVPVYLGAPDIDRYIPGDCFIDMRQFSGYEALRDYLKGLSARDVRRYKENARQFIKSPQYHRFSKAAFAGIFANLLSADTGITIGDPAHAVAAS